MIKIYKKYEELINYLIIGILTTVVSLATYYLLTLTILDANNKVYLQIANIISWLASVTFAYFTNRKFVFKVKNKSNIKECLNFYISRISTLLIDMIIMYIFVSRLKFDNKIVKLIAQVAIIILNYILSKFIVFKSSKEVENNGYNN